MVDLLKNDRKHKTKDIKDEYLSIDCRFIFGSEARAEKLFSRYKYIKTETRNRLTPQLFEAINFLKLIENFGKVTTINLTCNNDE